MKKILLLAILLIMLPGCLAGAFVAGGAAAGGLASDARTFEAITDDEDITHQANRQIAADQTLMQQVHIMAVSYNHVVLLVGQAPNAALREKAAQLVQKVPKIKRIFNEVTISEPTSALRRSKDAAITANVKTRMLTTTNLKSNHFKVVTEDGTVFLMGLSTRKQADIAGLVARSSEGVKKVVKLVEYITDTAN